mmetsp:Transcript_4716/g.3872  ORF Transcript_4716/g.3872 Transcript_4716/m.3872 type:complete len:86 (+) Transcript_4716:165-422(+)
MYSSTMRARMKIFAPTAYLNSKIRCASDAKRKARTVVGKFSIRTVPNMTVQHVEECVKKHLVKVFDINLIRSLRGSCTAPPCEPE